MKHTPDSPTASAAASVDGIVPVSSAVPLVQLYVLLPSPPLPHMALLPLQLLPAPPAEQAAVAHPEFCDAYQT